jgi:RimJ/RimL family protein N-acetyltransferase
MSSPRGARALELRPATAGDARYVWAINNHPTVRAQSVRTGDIPWETHETWFGKQLVRTDGRLLVAVEDGVPVGVARFDVEGAEAVVSIAVGVEHRGRGLGRRIVEHVTAAAFAHPGVRRAVAFTRPDNVASQRAFLGNGYRAAGDASAEGVALLRFEKALP